MIRTWTSEVRLSSANLDLKSEVQISRIYEVYFFGSQVQVQIPRSKVQISRIRKVQICWTRVESKSKLGFRPETNLDPDPDFLDPGSRFSGPGSSPSPNRVFAQKQIWTSGPDFLDLRSKSRFAGPKSRFARSRFCSGPDSQVRSPDSQGPDFAQVHICRSEVRIRACDAAPEAPRRKSGLGPWESGPHV